MLPDLMSMEFSVDVSPEEAAEKLLREVGEIKTLRLPFRDTPGVFAQYIGDVLYMRKFDVRQYKTRYWVQIGVILTDEERKAAQESQVIEVVD
jgi:hypothetical protein